MDVTLRGLKELHIFSVQVNHVASQSHFWGALGTSSLPTPAVRLVLFPEIKTLYTYSSDPCSQSGGMSVALLGNS